MGGGVIHLVDIPGLTAHGMTAERIAAIRPLLLAQPYVAEVRPDYKPYPGDPPTIPVIDLNLFRFMQRDLCNEWLPNHYLDVNGVDRRQAHPAWLTVQPSNNHVPVVIARSARYHNPRFPWRKIVEMYGEDNAIFIGTPAEHAAFNLEFDANLPHALTLDLMDVARCIDACMLFIGNQSCPLAIAEGLKVPVICEVCPYCPNCISPRANFWAGRDESIGLPDLEQIYALCQ